VPQSIRCPTFGVEVLVPGQLDAGAVGVGTQDLTFGSVLYGFGQDGGGVVIIYDHDVFVSFAECDQKLSRLIGINMSRYRNNLGIH
jgi:hypothetical protein